MSRVVFVSQDTPLADRLRRLIGRQVAVEAVPNARAAVTAARQHRPNLIILDWSAGELQSLNHLREDPATSGLPILVMASGDTPALLGRGAGGVSACFPKPVPFDELRAVLHRVAPPGAAGAPPESRPKVLVCDDDMEYVDLMSVFLKDAGYLPVLALSGGHVAEMAESQKPVAILLDLMLPGPDGLELLRQLRTNPKTKDVPVCVISALQLGTGHAELLVKDAPDDVLRKALAPRLAEAAKPKLLLADDEIDLLELMREALESEGFLVDTASDGKEALEKLQASPHDAAILDVKMPRKTGLELCQEMRRDPVLKELPIIMLSAAADRHTATQGVGLGADDFVAKPVDIGLLVRRVRQVIARRGRRV